MTVYRDVAQGTHDKTAKEYKLVFIVSDKTITQEERCRPSFIVVIHIALYKKARLRWEQRPRSMERQKQLDAVCRRPQAA